MGRAISPLFFSVALVGCVEDEQEFSFVIGTQPDCSVQDIDFAFDAPVNEGNGIVSWVDAGGGPDDDRGGPTYSQLMIASCSSQKWIGATWDRRDEASNLLARLRASDEQVSEMLDEFQAAGASKIFTGAQLQHTEISDHMGGMSAMRCGCDIYYSTDFGRYGASHQ